MVINSVLSPMGIQESMLRDIDKVNNISSKISSGDFSTVSKDMVNMKMIDLAYTAKAEVVFIQSHINDVLLKDIKK